MPAVANHTESLNVPLHPESRRLLDELEALGLPPISTVTLEEARGRLLPWAGALEEVGRVVDEQCAGPAGAIRVRRYHPLDDSTQPRHLLVFFHGGGWLIGSIESHDDLCRRLANACAAVVVSVDYRLAPEAPYPAAVEDCLSALEWADGSRESWGVTGITGVAGDSAGGNLAAVVAQRARDRGTPSLGCQLLLYPVTDWNLDSGSYLAYSEGYGLTRESMGWFWQQYLGDQDPTQPGASPLRAGSLAGLPATYVVTAEYDTLRDEGDAYARRLEAAGVSVTRECLPGLLHGFLLHGDRFDEVDEVMARIGQYLRRLGG